MRMIKHFVALPVLVSGLVAAGCGGDSNDPPNQPPTVSIEAASDAWEKDTVTLNALANDPEGASLNFLWEQTSGPEAVMDNASAQSLAFTAPDITEDTELSFRITVTDSAGNTASDDVILQLRNRWADVACEKPSGSWNIALSTDGGETLQVADEPEPFGNIYTRSLAALHTPGLLLTAYGKSGAVVARSQDSGCNWESLGTASGISMPVMLAAGNDSAYVWDWFSANYLVVDATAEPGSAIEKRTFPFDAKGGLSGNRPIGMGVLEGNPNEIAIMDDYNNTVWYSHDGGETWEPSGTYSGTQYQLTYRATFNPRDLQHIVLGVSKGGTYVTFDGGRTWTRSVINTASVGGDVMGYEVQFVPGSSDVLWLNGRDMDVTNGHPDERASKYFYRSTDGGLTFDMMANALEDDLILTNGNFFAAPPNDPDVLYFTHFNCATSAPDDSGVVGVTILYRYDAVTDTVTQVWDKDVEGIDSITFSPDDPRVMWFGLSITPTC